MSRDDEIFEEAIELPPAARAAFVERACGGDAAQRARVLELLKGHDASQDFLEQALVNRPPSPEEKPGDVIGRYTLRRKIGEGGCGVVYLADQTTPVRRQVALKVIKLGMDTRQVIARFEAERQALAMMDHPDIARVLDAGATETGRPFFVMEFVDGVPITKFCDEQRLAMPARLELFARVCLALQHAHQKGIVHRDLKPSNILVALHDGVPAPRVIDFGIAKATQGRITEQTLVTGFEQFIGTPAYMSPEQAGQRDVDIDTRSDVYSLGVLLYELLAGRPPYDPQALVRAGVEEIRRIIREVEPPRPSTRVSTLADVDRATVARLRRAGPVHLTSVLRGDLDWIVMRCLEKDRERRYGTAQELAEDVRRHLRREPVVARPPEMLYRVQKFVARHRLACASAAAIAAALILGTVVSVRQAQRALRAEAVARAERDVAQTATRAETLARADAQRRQEQAEALLTFMLGDFRTDLKKIGRLEVLDAVGAQAMAYFAALDPRDLTDTALTRQARALTQIGETRMEQARYAEASEAFTNAQARAAALAGRHPQNGDMVFERAQAEYWIGYVARERGEFTTAREWLVRYRDSALELQRVEGASERAQLEVTYGHHNLAVLDFDRAQFAQARAGFVAEKAVMEAILAESPAESELRFSVADIASWLGYVAEREGRFAEAMGHFSEMKTRVEALAAEEPGVMRWQSKLAESLTSLGILQAVTGRREEAAENFARSQSILAAMVERDPKNRQWQGSALNISLLQTSLVIAGGEFASAAPMLESARQQLEALVAAEPTSLAFAGRLARAWAMEAWRRFSLEPGGADAGLAAQRAIEHGAALIAAGRADDRVRGEFAAVCVLAGRMAQDRGEGSVAREHWQRALEVLTSRWEQSHDWRLLDPAAQALLLLGRTEEAGPLVERLRDFGYCPLDPRAAATLGFVPLSVSPSHQP